MASRAATSSSPAPVDRHRVQGPDPQPPADRPDDARHHGGRGHGAGDDGGGRRGPALDRAAGAGRRPQPADDQGRQLEAEDRGLGRRRGPPGRRRGHDAAARRRADARAARRRRSVRRRRRACRSSIPKTTRWRSTTTRWPGSDSAISRPGSAPRPRCRSPTPRPSASSTACSTWPAACTATPACTFGDKRWFTRMHGTDLHLLDIKRTWTLRSGRFFTEDEQDRQGDGAGARLGGGREAVRRQGRSGGQGHHAVEPDASGSWAW